VLLNLKQIKYVLVVYTVYAKINKILIKWESQAVLRSWNKKKKMLKCNSK